MAVFALGTHPERPRYLISKPYSRILAPNLTGTLALYTIPALIMLFS